MSQLKPLWKTTIGDYVTVLDWSDDCLAIASAAGEVILQYADQAIVLRAADGQSIDCLAFSHDHQFLASGSQNSQVNIWSVPTATLITPTVVKTLEYPRHWIDRLAWHPQQNQLAFSLGKQVQVWDVTTDQAGAQLNFAGSSVMDLAWHPAGLYLAVSGYLGTKLWRSDDWLTAPQILEVPSASAKVGWSTDGRYFASGNLDRMITLVETEQWEKPWAMRGFPGKIRCLAWSDNFAGSDTQLLAVSSQEGIAVWHYVAAQENWDCQVLQQHTDSVQAIAFQPGTSLLASTASDGQIALWQDGQLLQTLSENSAAGACLAWSQDATQLAVGRQNGQIEVFAIG
ncbi:hypothetical protein IQ266_10660 [filamentous cyanobacterium LEGE 11480]|uniref:Anaphase-promoting complex subunit 4-like WD40 domain-containing protein n=1 Tax=Romeriopsis navalis LEGE 11480 TaxID=2777977 RepID=A0A928VPE2_9CYAN|nr:hypothetical protein [Romeriopsis navalis]MBE9030190.1 hypothetical protein [Romeriopsis navalis LEGE 11480]